MTAENKSARPVVLFDLDGTLLPMDNSTFERAYFKGLTSVMTEVAPDELVAHIWAGTKAMIMNDGSRTNREAFAEVFTARSGIDYYANEERFLEYYRTGFQECAKVCGITSLSKRIVSTLQSKGYIVAIATNPIFPKIAMDSRLAWLGIDAGELSLVTDFQNCRYAKPNPKYYEDICGALCVKPSECLMIGNDADEDGAALSVGMEVMLVTDCLINKKNIPLDGFKTGTLGDVLKFAESLPKSTGKSPFHGL